MEKEKLSTELRGMVGENSLSERTWNDYLENSVMPFLPDGEDKMNDFLTKHANALKSINGQLNNEVAAKVNEFKKNYKPLSVSSEQLSVNNPDKPGQNADDEKLNNIEARLQKFEDEQAVKQATEAKQKLLDEAKKRMKEQGASHETVLELILPQLEITGNTTAEDLAKAGKARYDKAYSDLYGDSYVPVNSGGGYGVGISKKDKESYMQHLKDTGRVTE